MKTFLMITAPATITDRPLAAPSVIKSLISKKFNYKFLDLNAEFNQLLNQGKLSKVNDFFLYGDMSVGSASAISRYIQECVDRTIDINPTWVGLSLFSYQCQRFAELFSKQLKTLAPHISIVFGGPGLYENGIEGTKNLGKTLYEDSIIDLYIVGEAETQLLNKLESQLITDTWEQEIDINVEEFPDFSDYNFDLFDSKSIPITGSRGCVRKCTFCDIHTHWKKFVFRSGENIFNEMKYQYEKHGVTHFNFTDSLVNGSMLAYRDMITYLSNHNTKTTNPFTWQSQFIARPKNQMTEQDWKLTKLSGAQDLFIGVENLNEHIRDHMQKKFSNDDLFFTLEQAQKNKIQITFLMICGYITETDEDHLNQIEIFKSLTKFQDILKVSLGTTLGILPGTPLYENHKKYGVVLGNTETEWYNPSIDNTFEKRLRWRSELEEKLIDLGYNLNKNNEQHLLLESWK